MLVQQQSRLELNLRTVIQSTNNFCRLLCGNCHHFQQPSFQEDSLIIVEYLKKVTSKMMEDQWCWYSYSKQKQAKVLSDLRFQLCQHTAMGHTACA